MTPKCKHCLIRLGDKPRTLCNRCYYSPAIRALYPSQARSSPKFGDDMTADEVEALVAEQMQSLPEWWKSDAFAMQRREQPVEMRVVRDPRRR